MSTQTEPDEAMQKLLHSHIAAQGTRRALEDEQKEIGTKAEQALTAGNVELFHKLQDRRNALPRELQTASAIEHQAYSKVCQANRIEEQERADTLEDQLEGLQDAHKKAVVARTEQDAKEVKEIERAQVKFNSAIGEVNSWSTRYTEANTRFTEALREQA